ncbi:MAG TPA: response regulator [Kiloniellaceae bacterium]|nr:response regulator [Kiloniellaceae bacterium]
MSLSDTIAPHLPYLRRYARALTGAQVRGDAYVRTCLEAILADPELFEAVLPPRVTLYRIFYGIWSSSQVEVPEADDPLTGHERSMAGKLQLMTPQNRQALLLVALEGFSPDEAAIILNVEPDEVPVMLEAALADIQQELSTDVLIIEDEPIISLDLTAIVEEMGHRVVGVATTHRDALAAARTHAPGLVLADIQLADDSSGIDAVRDILKELVAPVIFITAFPDRLLTGNRPEPTFLVTKPFQSDTVKAAIGQALLFADVSDK